MTPIRDIRRLRIYSLLGMGKEFFGSTEFSGHSTTRTVTWKMPRIPGVLCTEFPGSNGHQMMSLKNSE